MNLSEILLISIALAVDAFAVGAAVGATHRAPRQIFRLSFHFGLFQALLPLVGAGVGALVSGLIASISHWAALLLLSAVGTKMIYESVGGEDKDFTQDPTRGWSLIALSVAVSIDALAVGFTMGLQDVSILFVVSIIGVVAAGATLIGMHVAGALASRYSKRLEPIAGLVLIGLGIKAVVTHYI